MTRADFVKLLDGMTSAVLLLGNWAAPEGSGASAKATRDDVLAAWDAQAAEVERLTTWRAALEVTENYDNAALKAEVEAEKDHAERAVQSGIGWLEQAERNLKRALAAEARVEDVLRGQRALANQTVRIRRVLTSGDPELMAAEVDTEEYARQVVARLKELEAALAYLKNNHGEMGMESETLLKVLVPKKQWDLALALVKGEKT
jgi:hypothetical protein